MRSPNVLGYPSSLVLVRSNENIDVGIGSHNVLIESRRTSEGVYFRYYSPHSSISTHVFSQLASPLSAPRSIVDTYIL